MLLKSFESIAGLYVHGKLHLQVHFPGEGEPRTTLLWCVTTSRTAANICVSKHKVPDSQNIPQTSAEALNPPRMRAAVLLYRNRLSRPNQLQYLLDLRS